MAPPTSDPTNPIPAATATTGRGETRPSVDKAIAATAKPILEFGRTWMMAPATAARGQALGLKGPFGFWTTGRGGVLGDVDADVVAAAIGFMSPAQIAGYWVNRPADVPPMSLSEAYAEAAAEFGRVSLATMADDDVQRLAELADTIAAAALPSTGVLFAGWRGIRRPDDPAGNAAVVLNVLREMRAGAHLSAVNAVGLGPHGAIISTDDPVRGGIPWAERFGWTAPHPTGDFARREQAESLTSEMCRPAYSALSDTELEEFSTLVLAARATIAD